LRDHLHVAVAVNVHDQDHDQVNHDVARLTLGDRREWLDGTGAAAADFDAAAVERDHAEHCIAGSEVVAR
jgi:hypothetical protein